MFPQKGRVPSIHRNKCYFWTWRLGGGGCLHSRSLGRGCRKRQVQRPEKKLRDSVWRIRLAWSSTRWLKAFKVSIIGTQVSRFAHLPFTAVAKVVLSGGLSRPGQLLKWNVVFRSSVIFPQTRKDDKTEMEKVTDKSAPYLFPSLFLLIQDRSGYPIASFLPSGQQGNEKCVFILTGAGGSFPLLWGCLWFSHVCLFIWADLFQRGASPLHRWL